MEWLAEPGSQNRMLFVELKGRHHHDRQREILADTSFPFNNILWAQGQLQTSGVKRTLSAELGQL